MASSEEIGQLPKTMTESPACPHCGSPLGRVRRSSESMLNDEQFDAIRAGDWFCKCTTDGNGSAGYCYFWQMADGMIKPRQPQVGHA